MNDFTRELGFRWRSAMTWSLPGWKRRIRLSELRQTLSRLAGQRLDELEKKYQLADWERCCGTADWAESLYVLDVLDRHLVEPLPSGRALDIGSKNGCYLPGLATARSGGWDAVELDAHRRYLWGSTRRAYGEAMAETFPACRYWGCDVRAVPGTWSLMTWFLPFLTPHPLEAWGLPLRHFDPKGLLQHVLSRLAPGGMLFIVNQGEAEAAFQLQLLESFPEVKVTRLGRIESALSPFERVRIGFRVHRPTLKTRALRPAPD